MKSFLSITLLITCSALLFFDVKPNPKNTVLNSETQPPQNVNINVHIDNTTAGIRIPDDFLGLDFEMPFLTDTTIFKTSNTVYLNLMNALGHGIMRVSGYYTNFIPWSNHKRTPLMSKGRLNYLTDSIATTDIDSLFAFIRKTKWKIILGVNETRSTPQRTYSEINYAWSHGKDVISAFEMGNEPDGLFAGSFAKYYQDLLPHYTIIEQNLPGVPFCGPATVHPLDQLFKDFMNTAAGHLKYITIHDYSVGDSRIPDNLNQLLDNKAIEKSDNFFSYVNKLVSSKGMRYRVDECNDYGDEGIDVSDRFASALWGIDFMFTAAKNNSMGINFIGGGRGFTPIYVLRGHPVTPHPLYYAMLFFHKASQGSILPLNINNDKNPTIKAYAVLDKNDRVLVTLLNKDPNNDAMFHIFCKNPMATASYISLTAPSVSSKDGVTLGGASIDKYGNWKAASIKYLTAHNGDVALTVPKGSAILVTMSK
jgi:hypothetical protein